jgi:hypothetical protein
MYVHEQKGDPRANKHELDLVVEEIIKEKGKGRAKTRENSPEDDPSRRPELRCCHAEGSKFQTKC